MMFVVDVTRCPPRACEPGLPKCHGLACSRHPGIRVAACKHNLKSGSCVYDQVVSVLLNSNPSKNCLIIFINFQPVLFREKTKHPFVHLSTSAFLSYTNNTSPFLVSSQVRFSSKKIANLCNLLDRLNL